MTVAAPGVLGNDSDPDSDSLTAVMMSDPLHGLLTFNPDSSFSYAPAANWSGTDSFTYVANDGAVNSNEATVTITVYPVNDPPVTVDDIYTPVEGQAADAGANNDSLSL